jgi:hypothetical protein
MSVICVINPSCGSQGKSSKWNQNNINQNSSLVMIMGMDFKRVNIYKDKVSVENE